MINAETLPEIRPLADGLEFLPEKQCAFNIDTMEEITDVVACGANAINKRVKDFGERIERYASPKDVKTYLSKIEEIMRLKRMFFA